MTPWTAKWQLFLTLVFAISFLFGGSFSPVFAAKNGVVSLSHENDLFAGDDQYYTSGARLSWYQPDWQVPVFLRATAEELGIYRENATQNVSYRLGQNMFTPQDITDTDPSGKDRPYAGWLYGSVGITQDHGDRIDALELEVGVAGPSAGAENTQKEIHKWVDAPQPRGWETQLHDELGVNLQYGHRNVSWSQGELWGDTFQLMPGYAAAVGNVRTSAKVSTMVRWGEYGDRDYGPPLIRSAMPGSGYFEEGDGFEWYLFLNVAGEYVAHDLFLDGNTIRDSRSVDREPWLGEAQTGLVLTWYDYRLSYTHIFPTREFETQSGTDDYGAFTLSGRF